MRDLRDLGLKVLTWTFLVLGVACVACLWDAWDVGGSAFSHTIIIAGSSFFLAFSMYKTEREIQLKPHRALRA